MAKLPLIFYQIFVRSFADSNHDGTGDLKGITLKLDYLKWLGAEAIWLSPIFKSPSYHKYDISDYYAIDPEYGTMADFEELISEAKMAGIRVILDLVVSHTSRQHQWFKAANSSKTNEYRDYYIWKSKQVIRNLDLGKRIATMDSSITKPWHGTGEEKYYGIFSESMPDLNLENQKVRIEILEIARFWMRKGVYGFRLDAARHIYPAWFPVDMNIAFWEALRTELEGEFGEVYLVGEVWSQPEIVAPYFKGLKANFNFELCYDIREVLSTGKDEKDLIKKLINTYKIYGQVSADFIDATFLGNHDQERIASTLQNHTRKLKAAVNLLMTLPGNPFIYYGEELGTEGKKPDSQLREPFVWDYHERDFYRVSESGTYSNEKRLTPLSVQASRPESLFSHYRKMISFRKDNQALARITPVNLEASDIEDSQVISFFRTDETQKVFVLQNISGACKTIPFTTNIKSVLLVTENSKVTDNNLVLEPWGLLVIELETGCQ